MKNIFLVTLIVLVSFLVTGCAVPKNQGRLAQSFEVTQLVESGAVLPGHTYYYTGPEVMPDAIIAVDNRYALKSKYWIQVDNVEEQLAEWNRYIENDSVFRYTDAYSGAWLTTPDEQRAGIWYSKYDHTVVRFPDASSIIIYAPVVPVEHDSFSRLRSP